MRSVARLIAVLASAALVAGQQHAFVLPDTASASRSHALRGRFLHVTDLHIDEHYRPDSAVVSQCHHDKPHVKHGGSWRAGYFGTAVSDCDSPVRLPNASLHWVARRWGADADDDDDAAGAPPFDFILWTGDSARHDQDARMERTQSEIQHLNSVTLSLLETHFPGVPIVPNMGNNDIVFHNTLAAGPSDELAFFSKLWSKHIPPSQQDAFRRGGYFAKDLIPGHLGVISLNTLYFFDSNKAVDGCPRRRRNMHDDEVDAGTRELEWLTDRLIEFRRRNMQVHIIGHVPPTAGNYFSRCFDKYTELVLRFQDTIIGQHFGHMNLDAFFIQESSVVNRKASKGTQLPILYKLIEEDLRFDYESLPGNARIDMDYYASFFEAPSMVPTYLPSFRVWTYNTSREHDNRPVLAASVSKEDEALLKAYVSYDLCESDDHCDDDDDVSDDDDDVATIFKKDRSHRRPKRKRRRNHDKLPRYASPQSPARTNTFMSLLGYSQWTLDLDAVNDKYEKLAKKYGHDAAHNITLAFDLEYTTYEPGVLWHEFLLDELPDTAALRLPTPHHHNSPEEHHVPVPRSLLQDVLDTHKLESPFSCRDGVCHLLPELKHLTNYERADMTLRSVMDLARRLVLDNKLWDSFAHRLYTNSLR